MLAHHKADVGHFVCTQ